MLTNIIDLLRLPFRKDRELLYSLRQILGFYPHKLSYYQLALMHRSGGRREKGTPINNERLEFLGDAILSAVVSDIVYKHFGGKREGFLTNTRSKIVQRETLNKLADEMGLDKMIVSKTTTKSHNNNLGGNAFEALIGAIYLDKGYRACKKFMEKRILANLINIDKVAKKEVNFKSKLIEWSQKNRIKLEFRLISSEKENDVSPTFHYMAVVEGIDGCEGKGYSKKESQQIASKLTLERLRKNPQFIDEVFAAKTNRTKMEEMPVTNVPDISSKTDFIQTDQTTKNNDFIDTKDNYSTAETHPEKDTHTTYDDFDLSDITANPQKLTREEIIAKAEQAAFEGKE